MKAFLKENFTIVLAFSLPVILILVIALGTYVPSLFVSTDYNFIYSACTEGARYSYKCDDYLQRRYAVVDGKLLLNTIDPKQDSDKDGVSDINENYNARLFFHDTKKNETKEITLEEAQTFTLNSLLTSPDGVTVSGQYDRGGDFLLLFGSGSSHGYYLMKGNASRKLNLITNDDRYYYRNNFRFIGWVLPGRS